MAAWLSLSAAVYVSGSVLIQAQYTPDYLVDHSDCTFFGANREKFAHTGLNERRFSRPDQQFRLGALTRVVANALPAREARPMVEAAAQPDLSNTIDLYLFAAMKDAGVAPAEKSTDLEFIRPFPDKCVTEFAFKPEGNETVVTWTMTGHKKFMAKAVCMFMNMDKMVGGDFERGLASLKSVSETSTKK